MRIEKAKLFARMAQVISEASTCARVQVGAILVKDGRAISNGYNGSAPGEPHCKDIFRNADFSNPEISTKHHEYSLKEESHAELNSILQCAKKGISTEGAILFTTVSPCDQCSKAIVQAGIKEVYYITKYDRDISGLEYMERCGVKVYQIEV